MHMKLNFRRLLAMFLSIVMVAGMLPAAVFAEGGVETQSETYVAQVGETQYTDLQEAIVAAQAGDTIVLLANQTFSGQNAADKLSGYVIDLNDKTITLSGNTYLTGETTIKNGNIVVSGFVSDSYLCLYTADTKLTLDDVSLTGTMDCYAVLNAATGSTLIIKNSTIDVIGSVTNPDAMGNIIYGGNVTVDNSTIKGVYTVRGIGFSNITIQNGSTVDISNVETGLNCATVTVDSSTVTITNATKRAVRLNNNTLTLQNGATLTATGCAEDIIGIGTTDVVSVSSDSTLNAKDNVTPAGPVKVTTYEELIAALEKDNANVIMMNDITATATQASSYGKAGIVLGAGDVLDGNNFTLTINGANSTWDCAIAMTGGEVKNLTIAGAMRGVFMPGANDDVVIDNCVFKDVVYTFNSDAGSKEHSVTIKNTTLNGWTSFSNVHKSVTFESCTFGKGSGYAFCRPYQATTFTNCTFTEGFTLDTTATVDNNLAFNECTYNGTALSAKNNAMFPDGGKVLIDGVSTDVTNYPPTGSNSYAYTKEEKGYVRVWGQSENTNAAESYVLKLYSGETLIATTVLNDVGNIIDGSQDSVTWNFYYPESTDEYWTTTWEEGHPNSAAQPTEVELYIDGTLVATTDAKMSGADGVNPVVWEALGGVKKIVTGLSGEGTAEDPFLINNLEELKWFRDTVDNVQPDRSNQFLGKYVKLTANIDLAGINWNPIGEKKDHGSFMGIFDGGDHTISNLYVEQAGEYLGLFAYTGSFSESEQAVIKNLTLHNVTVKSTDNSNYVGGLVGNATTTNFENIHVTGTVEISGRGYIGGIVGHGYSDFNNVSVRATNGTISSTFWCAGGVIGYLGEGSTIKNAVVEGLTIKSAAGGLGSIVGMSSSNDGTQPCTGENLSAKNVAIQTYTGAYGDGYAENGLGYLIGGDTSVMTGSNTVENVTFACSNGTTNPDVSDAVASVNGTIYFDLQSALDEANSATVTLLRDATENITIANGATVNLDMDGNTLNGYFAPFSGALTINGGWIVNTNSAYSAIEINGGTLDLNNVHISSARHGIRIDGEVTATIDGDGDHITIKSAASTGTGTYHAINVSGNANVTINNCAFIGPKGTTADSGSAVNVKAGATVTINGGNFSGGKNATLSVSGTLSITGGTFDQDPTAYVASGYKAEENEGIFSVVKSNTIWEVATKAELADAVDKAQAGDTILLTADIDYGTDQLKLEKAITLDLGGKTLTTRNAWGGMSVKNNPTIKNGTIVHASNTAAIKVWNATAFEDLVIDVQGKGDANKTIGGIVLQEGSTTHVGSIKNVTIKGVALTNGIETYNCGNATEPVIGSMEDVTIDAKSVGLNISAPCGTATNCSIKGGTNGIEIWIKGTYSATLDLVDCDVVGGVFAHDEFSSNPSIVNNGTLKLTADDATTGASEDAITLTIARAEKVEGILEEVMDNAQAKVNDTYYATLASAIAALKDGDTLTIFAGEISEGTIKFPATLKNVTIKGAADNASILKDMTLMAHDGSNIAYEGITFDGIVFDNSNILFSGQRASASFKDWKITNCTFKNVARGNAAISFNLNTSEAMENFTFTNNVIDGVTGGNYSGLVLRASKGKIDVTNNDIKNVAWNAIQLINSTADTLTVTGNSFASDADEGILNLYGVTATALTIKSNKFLVTEGQPGVCHITAADVSENYWGGNAPANLPAGVVYTSYYADEALTNLVMVSYVAEVDGTKYTSLQDAIDKAQNNDTITFLTDITENVTISKNLTIDGAEKEYTGTMTANAGLTVTVQNVNFVNGGFAKTTKSTTGTYTIKKCTFVDDGAYNYSFIFKGANEITIEDCTVKGYKYSFLYITAGTNKVSVKNVTVEDCPNYAVYFASGVNSATIENLTVKNSDNGFVINNTANRALTIKNCTMENVTTAINHSKGTNAITCTVLGVNDFGAAATSEYAKYVLGATDATLTASNGLNVTSGVDGYEVKYAEGVYKLISGDPAEGKVAKIGETMYETLAEALTAAGDGETITLLYAEGDAPIAMNGAVYGKTVTITGTAIVDWSKGNLFVGRGGEGDGTVIFDNANLTSASNQASTGIHVSGREKDTDNKYDGTLVIKNSTIELDYLINKGTMTLDNSTLTVKNGFSVGGRPASETESGEDATAILNLTNGSKVIVNNHNGMGLGYEAIGVMNIDATSAFETTQSFLVTAKGTMNVNGGTVNVVGTLTNNGNVNFTNVTLKDITIGGSGTTCFYNTINFYGTNSITSGIDGTPFELIVNKGATLLISRFVLGYDRNITVYGEIEDAHAFDPTDKTPSLKFNSTSGVSVGGYGTGNLTVEDAYIELGNSSWKNAQGTYTWRFKNSYVSATSFTDCKAPYTDSASWTVTFDDSVLAAKNYIKNGVRTTYNFINGSVATTGSIRIDGELYIDETSSVTTTSYQNNMVGAQDEHGDITGTVKVDGTLTIGSNAALAVELRGGELHIGSKGKVDLTKCPLTIDADSKVVIDATDMSAGAYAGLVGTVVNNGTIEVIKNDKLTAEIDDNGNIVLVEVKTYVAQIGETMYETLEKAFEAAQAGDVVTILAGDYTTNLSVSRAITVVGETDAEGNNLVNITGKLNITADGATVKNINVNNGGSTGGYINAKDVLVEGCTVVGGNGFRSCYTSGTVTFKDSTITGATYGIHFDGSAGGNIVIDNCVITGWTSFASTINKVTMTKTTFEEGNYNYVRFYQEDVVIDGCTFNEKMAVDISDTVSATVTVTNSTVENGTVEGLFSDTDIVGSDIYVDGVKLTRVAKIGNTYYETFAAALDAVKDGETITVLEAEGSERTTEIDFDKAINFTITGNSAYELPTITFKNATVNIVDADIEIGELDARKNATINVKNSTVETVGNGKTDGIVKAYFNGKINIENSEVYAHQFTVMGVVNITGSSELTVTWQTNVYGNGLITIGQNATLNTAAMHLTGQDYNDRNNTDDDRVGKPAQITVNGGTLNVGTECISIDGANYNYYSSEGINIGTIAGKQAVLDIVNGAKVNIYMADGETANIGADGTVNVNGTLTVGCRAANGTATLVNNGSIVLTDATSVVTANECGNVTTSVDGYAVEYADGKYTVVEVELKEFYGSSATMGNELDLNFYFSTAYVANTGYAQIVRTYGDGRADETTTVPLSSVKLNGDYYQIIYEGIAAKEMCDVLKVTIYDQDGKQVSEEREESVRSYAIRVIKSNSTSIDSTAKTMMVDMLNYGAAAQEYLNYNTSDLANSTLTEEQKALGTQEMVTCTNKFYKSNDSYRGTSFVFGNELSLKMYVKKDAIGANGYVVVTYTNHLGQEKTATINTSTLNNDYYEFLVNEIVVADGRCLLTCTFYKADGTEVVTVKDSLESYVARGLSTYGWLEQVMNFSDSAHAYLHRNDK